MKLRCDVCRQRYGRHDDRISAGRRDSYWNPADGRCYDCHLEMRYGIFGAALEPAIELNGVRYGADWSAPVEGGGVNIPF